MKLWRGDLTAMEIAVATLLTLILYIVEIAAISLAYRELTAPKQNEAAA